MRQQRRAAALHLAAYIEKDPTLSIKMQEAIDDYQHVWWGRRKRIAEAFFATLTQDEKEELERQSFRYVNGLQEVTSWIVVVQILLPIIVDIIIALLKERDDE